MTPKERVLAALSGKRADGVPAVPMVAGDHAARLCGVPLKRIYQDGATLGQVLVSAYRHYGLDAVIVFSDVAVEAQAIGAQLEFPEDGIPFVVKPSAQLKVPNPWCDGRMPLILEATRTCLDALEDEALVFASIKGPFSLATLISEPEAFFSALLTDPKQIHEKLEFALEVQRRYVDAIATLGEVALFVGDPFATGELIGPDYFEQFALPYCRRLMDHIHGKGLDAVLHICGQTQNLLRLIPRTGAQAFSVDEINLPLAQAELEGEVALMGNVSTQLLRDGTAEQVFSAAWKCLQSTAGNPFILSSACDVPTATPEENVFALVKAARLWGELE